MEMRLKQRSATEQAVLADGIAGVNPRTFVGTVFVGFVACHTTATRFIALRCGGACHVSLCIVRRGRYGLAALPTQQQRQAAQSRRQTQQQQQLRGGGFMTEAVV